VICFKFAIKRLPLTIYRYVLKKAYFGLLLTVLNVLLQPPTLFQRASGRRVELDNAVVLVRV